MEGCRKNSKKGRRFGQRRPPLTELIQNILERYPDGGQILKELIQNADDAGATEVNFLYDNSYHGTKSLENPELAKFQGPALYCHNNATFKEEDWEGIQNLMRSNKKDDPLKVGRFGIGFNSVYHITDLPGIVSGETVGFLDPNEKYFEDESGKRESGKRYNIDENLLDPISSDQFLPFHGIFGCDFNTAKSYDGTLFRFPLRTTPSDLSKKKYTKEMIDNLFHSLRDEASVILLFLKSVQSIKVYQRNQDGQRECVLKVEVAEDTREDVKRKRKELLNKAKEPTITESKYTMNIQVTFGSQTENFRWLTVNQIGSTEERIAELADELCLLPWVGIAVPIDVETNNASSGRIFCFLPLPPDVDCQTGLPVHVHGYFGLTDNRRGLVWPGAECQNTATAEWNELLLKKIAVQVYCKILEALIQDVPCTGIGQEQRSQLIYSRLPALAKVQGHWKVILEPLFQKLILESKKLFYAQRISGNSWVTLNEGILDRLQESGIECETREAILKILLNSSQVLVTNVPPHVLEIVASYYSPPPRDITPSLLRSVLKSHDVNATSHDDKVLLLDFILRDDPTGDLNGIPLLPLSNKKFTTFCPPSHVEAPSTSIFVPTSSCTAMLLPNMSHRFLNENLPKALHQKLIAIADNDVHSKSPTQLVRLTKEIVLQNLRSSLPSEWFNDREKVQWTPGYSDHPPESWLKEIWKWINLSFPNTLSPFENTPLVDLPPLPTTTNKCLGVLSQHSRFIFALDGSGNVLPSQVIGLLTAAGCTILFNHPSYLHHPDINSYIASPTASGAMSVLSRASLQSAKEHIKLSTSSDRSNLREFLTRLPDYLTTRHKHFLRQLPLFETLKSTCTTVQVNGQILNAASPEFSLPSGFNFRKSDQLISSTDPKVHQLLTMLSVQILQPAEVFIRYLFPDIQANSVYSLQETSTIMLWILHQMFNFKSQCRGFQDAMIALPFVSTDKGHLKKPSELYDPNDALLSNLFLEETNKFPSKQYNDEHVISTLKELGLRTKSMLTVGELLRVAENIASSPHGSPLSIWKVRALVEILQENSTYLNQYVERKATLKDKLLQLKWLPSVKVPPESWRFPALMPWFNSNKPLFTPVELRSKSHALLVGSSMPIVDVEMNDELQEDFGLTVHPPLHHVVSQLNTAVKVWQQQDHRKATSQFQEMLVAIYRHLAQESKECVSIAVNDASLKQWIWHGTGFCSPVRIALEKDFLLDLQPQLFLVPEEFKDRPLLVQFFLNNGVRKSFSKEDILTVLKDMKDKPQSSLADVDASSEVLKDLKLCRSILEWMVKDGETLGEELQKKVFVPVQSTKNMLVLEPCAECTYYDREWLRGESDLIIPEDYKLIHNSIPAKVARLLGVPALSTSLLSAETLGFEFEQTGPCEPLTTRLNNILKEYKEGVGIFKELIQNADDAGASKVRFLVDWRQGPTEKLLSPKMVECQGPALWAYNDAVFTDKDFENINKLAGATKLEDLRKIGRFGLGFSAVYHLTDVPSFISRESVVIFDPNLNHLEWIKDKSRPGIRINLSTKPVSLRAFADQFQPYHNIFDCETQVKYGENFYYDGTLFRFPFRTLLQKEESKISQSVYNEEKVMDLVYSLKETAPHLLLYTQHVNQVELYVVSRDNGPEDMELELSVTKDTLQNLRSENRLSATFIEECSNWWQKKLASSDSSAASPSRFELVAINIQDNTYSLPGSTRRHEKQELWLLASCVGTDSSVEIASNEGRNQGMLPYAGAAVKISHAKGSGPDDFLSYYPESLQGEAFCFLPLSLPTGLPVHLNGYFAITSNRRGIWERDTVDHCQPIEVQWNECLMKDALSNAYIQLLEDMKGISENGTLEQYDFHMLWPCYDSLRSSTWEILVKSLYDKLVEDALPLFCSDGKWLSIHEGYILDEQLQEVDEVAEILKYLEWSIFQLPQNVCTSLEKSGHGPILAQQTLTFKKFLEMVFLPNINKISPRLRDALLCHCLDLEDLGSFFEDISCISCSLDGRHLAKPSELIHPNGAAATLFSEEDRRFPIGDYFLTGKRAFALEQLGMAKDLLSWDDICGRAESVEKLSDFERSRERARNLIKYLDKNIENLTKNDEAIKILQRTKFLPIKSEPPGGYFLPWKGSEHNEKQFGAPVDLYLPCDNDLVGSCCLIVDNSDESLGDNLSQKVGNLLGFSERPPEIEQVIQQLDTAIRVWTELNAAETNEQQQGVIESVCKRVYEYFENFVSQRNEQQQPQSSKHQDELDLEQFLTKLNEREWIFIRGRFSSTEKVAISWKGNAVPFLYHLPDEYSRVYKHLWSAAGVKDTFDEADFIHSLYALQDSKKGFPLSEEELKLVACSLNELKDVENETIKQNVGKIPLPDTNKILHRGESLTINQTFWLQPSKDTRYVHPDIPQERALNLGARSLKNRILRKYSKTIGTSFGQQEKLTDRLKSILQNYPCDSGILKELVQNADDAEASEIHFVYDTRRVLPSERVFQKNATEIQGPALCVYNDRPFKEEDLVGITKLGIGSKGGDPEKTGQYGIGFNAVYHLTDCPSFLSNDETLVILDPHCRYAPEATQESPGDKFHPIDDDFRRSFADSFIGYLGEYFNLKGSTMFRLPLRTSGQSPEAPTPIANPISNEKMSELFDAFRKEAMKTLLFLNHIKKITLSKIAEDGKLEQIYEVNSVLDEEHEKQRRTISSVVKAHKKTPTCQIPWESQMYPMTISDSEGDTESWLVHQCCGTQLQNQSDDNKIPDGQRYGLFPRGGIAALLSPPLSSTDGKQPLNVAYCGLPLPVPTHLPVVVNGHFALGSSRRGIWLDTEPNRELTKWNDFMKSRVLAPGYAALICAAQNYIPHCERIPNKVQCYFPDSETAKNGLDWYFDLFPDVSTDSEWKLLVIEVYRCLGTTRANVLPVIVDDGDTQQSSHVKNKRTSHSAQEFCYPKEPKSQSELNKKDAAETADKLPQKIRRWLPADEGYFITEESKPETKFKRLEKTSNLLLRICLPLLLHTPIKVYNGFQKADVDCFVTSPLSVMEFLRTFRNKNAICDIGHLPTMLKHSRFRNIEELHNLIKYCKNEKSFSSLLEDLPLLLTADGQLRIFDSKNPVYRSKFSDLFPRREHLFAHPEFVSTYNISKMTQSGKQEESASQVMRDFTLDDLVQFMPDVFPPSLRGVVGHVAWNFDNLLSKKRLTRLWEYLQISHADSDRREEPMSLELLNKWPIIPTTCGKLVTISDAKTVFDMTETGTETECQRKVREIIRQLKCPSLDNDITRGKPREASDSKNKEDTEDIELAEKASTASTKCLHRQASVTDPYVAHPHKVADVLQVLNHMRRTGILDVSVLPADEIHKMLKFFQDEFDDLNLENGCEEILKDLPLHKTIHEDHVSLSAFSSSAFVPAGVPLDGIKQLQSRTGCLFLHWDALKSLTKLYKSLGTQAGRGASKFYIDFILPHFSIFHRESQMKYLIHIKQELPISRERKEPLLRSLRSTRCVPNHVHEQGLDYAENFFDPRDEVFKVMLPPNKFPPKPFNDEGWLDFFIAFGLHKDFGNNNNRFFEFCTDVARIGGESLNDHDYKLNVQRSQQLVERLKQPRSLKRNSEFPKENLQDPRFLSKLRTIKFIASEKVTSKLSSIHQQYQCTSENRPPFISYRESVPCSYQNIVWTTAKLLPEWAQLREELESHLQISKKPTIDAVVNHMENICNSLAETTNNGGLPAEAQGIMNSIYSFLSENVCPEKEVSDRCSETCKDLGRRFNHKPCVYMEGTLIKGEQLSFKLPGNDLLNPFLYTIPRDYGSYEHLLKRLGATEKVTSLQLANLLKAIKDCCEDGKMDSNHEKKAQIATVLLLKYAYRESRHGKEESKISNLTELFLPSDNQSLVKSTELVSKVPLRLVPVISKQNWHVLFPLEKCGVPRACTEKYLASLPEHLRLVPLDRIVREMLDPSCRDATCIQCLVDSVCSFMEKYLNILRSKHFQEGVARVLLHQKTSNKLTEEEEERSSRFLDHSKVEIKCMESIKIYLVDVQTQKPLEEDYSQKIPGYIDRQDDGLKLYIVHETKSLGFLTKLVNEAMDSCIEDKYLPLLIDILQCDSPSQISELLTDREITLISSIDDLWSESSDESEDELDESDGVSGPSNLSRKREAYLKGPETYYRIPVDRKEAFRWMKQSLSDLEAAEFMLTADPPFNAMACFHSHEAVEKSLKALLYAKYDIDSEQLHSHRVDLLANDIENHMKAPSNLSSLAEKVKNYYVHPRYPNVHKPYVVPVEAYDQEQARKAIENATTLVETVKTLINWYC